MKKWVVLNLFFKLLDIGTTYWFISKFGREAEFNPLVRHTMDYFGPAGGLAAVFILFCGIVGVGYYFKAPAALKIIAVITGLVVINNFVQILLWS